MSASTTTTDRVFHNCRFYGNTRQRPVFRPHPALRVKTDVTNLLNKISLSNIFVYYIGLLIRILLFIYFTRRDGV